MSALQFYHHEAPFLLERGGTLPRLTIGYHTWGTPSADNVVWICHALTASSDAADWWSILVGPGKAFDPERHYIVCANILGSPYGTTSPLSPNPDTGQPYYHDFPHLTVRDLVAAHRLLAHHLGVRTIRLLAGGSLGGYQVLEWAAMAPEEVDRLFLIATSARESAWGIAAHTAQRMAIEADATWAAGGAEAGRAGLKAARATGMLLYRAYCTYETKQEDPQAAEKWEAYRAESYIRYQGEKLAGRFNAYSYYLLSRTMDTHHLGRGRSSAVEAVLQGITQPTLLISIEEDGLCPPAEAERMAGAMPQCTHHRIHSVNGHDGFLTEEAAITEALEQWSW